MRVYLAGPSVFRENPDQYGKTLVDMCHVRGIQGLYPLDNSIDQSLDKVTQSSLIFKSNIDLIRSADAVIADLNDFRGPEVDSGTAWEVGFAHSLNIPIFSLDLKH